MPTVVAGIHVLKAVKAWMAGSSPIRANIATGLPVAPHRPRPSRQPLKRLPQGEEQILSQFRLIQRSALARVSKERRPRRCIYPYVSAQRVEPDVTGSHPRQRPLVIREVEI